MNLDDIMRGVAAAIIQDAEIVALCGDMLGGPLRVVAGYDPQDAPEFDSLPIVQIATDDRSRSADLLDREHLLIVAVFAPVGGWDVAPEGYEYQPGRAVHERLAELVERCAARTLLAMDIPTTPVPAPPDRQWSGAGFGAFYGYALSFHDSLH